MHKGVGTSGKERETAHYRTQELQEEDSVREETPNIKKKQLCLERDQRETSIY
jgi:hypothetical protein